MLGHITTDGAVLPSFGGKVILTDAGLSRVYDRRGQQACLVIEHGKRYALHRGCRLDLPMGAGPELVAN